MLPCPRCERHLLPAATSCPFCGVEQRSTLGGPRLAIVMGVALTGCGPTVASGGSEDGSSSNGQSSGVATSTSTSSTSTSDATTDAATDATTATSSSSSSSGPGESVTVGSSTTGDGSDDWDTCGGFYGGCPPDFRPVECDVWAQDCPPGEKCMPWANDGGNVHNAVKCTPVDADPDPIGGACTVEGSAVSGVDSCVLGAICYGVDPETNTGTCVEQCLGSPVAPLCNTGECAQGDEFFLALCLPACDPLLDTCPPELSCHYVDEQAFCVGATSDARVGDACEFLGDCVAGSMCVAAAGVPDCPSPGCCAEVCDVTALPTTCAEELECAQPIPGGNDGVCILPS